MVCFYGDDLMLVRLAAMQYKLTVSAFMRLALQLYLDRLALDFRSAGAIHPAQFFAHAIKRWLRIELHTLNFEAAPMLHSFSFQSFFPWQWWPVQGIKPA